MSKRGYCQIHGPMIREAQWNALHNHSGPEFLKWRRAQAASVGAVLLDDIIGVE